MRLIIIIIYMGDLFMKKVVKLIGVSFLCLGIMTACQTKAPEASAPKSSAQITVTDAANRTLTFKQQPKKVAALSSGDMDIIHALGGEIVGRPTTQAPVSNPELQKATEIGNPHSPNFEKIAAVKPDVLIANSGFERHIPTLEKQGIQVYIAKGSSVDGIQKSIENYGSLLGKQDEAKKWTKQIADKLQSLQKEQPTKKAKALLVYGAPGSYMIALPSSLSGDLLSKVGGENIAAEFPISKEMPGYAQLSTERIVQSNPDVVYLITHGDPAAVQKAFEAEMKKNSAWNNLSAVKNGKIVVLPSHLFGSNPGTKVIESLDFLKDSLAKATGS